MIDLQILLETANRVGATLTDDSAQTKQIVKDHDVVIGVWPDPAEEGGTGTSLIKGQRALMAIATGGAPVALKWTAIPCASAGCAEALQLMYGEVKLS